MTTQSAANVLAAVRRETTTGTIATVTGASQIRLTGSPGLKLNRAIVQSAEKRDDGYKTMGRIGFKSVDGSFNGELTVGGATDLFLEAIGRSTWATATSISFATMTTVSVGQNTLIANGGSWITQGIRVGDVFYLSSTSVAGNNSTNVVVTAVTTLTITHSGTFSTITATATGTLTRLKKLVAATTPTRYSHSFEQYDEDTNLSEVFLGCRISGFKISARPGQHVQMTVNVVGMDRTALTTGTSPYFTSPSLTTTLGMIADDAQIRYNGASLAIATGFDLDFAIAAKAEPTIGSLVGSDVFDNDCTISLKIMGLRSDFSNITLFDAETEFEFGVLLQSPGSSPKDALGFFLPRVKIAALEAPFGGDDGAKIESLDLLVAPKVAATGYDGSPFVICSSAA